MADLAAGPQPDSALLELDFREVRGERREIGWREARCTRSSTNGCDNVTSLVMVNAVP
jgi:hypothetical protein